MAEGEVVTGPEAGGSRVAVLLGTILLSLSSISAVTARRIVSREGVAVVVAVTDILGVVGVVVVVAMMMKVFRLLLWQEMILYVETA